MVEKLNESIFKGKNTSALRDTIIILDKYSDILDKHLVNL